jgi:hypothetical protein
VPSSVAYDADRGGFWIAHLTSVWRHRGHGGEAVVDTGQGSSMLRQFIARVQAGSRFSGEAVTVCETETALKSFAAGLKVDRQR